MKRKTLTLLFCALLMLPGVLCGQQLTYNTSWLGNTFPGGDSYSADPAKAHIPNYIHNIWVDRNNTDGKVYTTSIWDEGNREKSIIQNGVVIARMPDPGHNVQHDAIAGDANYIYLAAVMHQCSAPNNGYGIRRFNHDGSIAALSNGGGCDKSYITIHGAGTDLAQIATAVAVNTDNKELYYADPVDGNIKVIDLNTNTVITSFSISGISDGNNRLAVGTDGYLWWLVRQDHKVYRYSNRGVKQSQEISDVSDPATITIDKNNNLFVADNGTSLQIRMYNNINSSPNFVKTIGDNGGVYSGNIGAVTDMKFHPGMAGLGTDSNGNTYLVTNGVDNSTGTILKSINSAGTAVNWQVCDLAFVDNFDFDASTNGADIYGRTEHFKMDYTKSHGQEWSYAGYTLNKNANPTDGIRGDGTAIIRNRDGKKFMYTIGMFGNGFNLYRFDVAPSEICAPIGSITRDGGYAWDVDNNCDVWSGGAGGKIRRYAYPGITLNYNTSSPEEWAIPGPFTAVDRVKYIAETDVMYIAGWSDAYPNSKNDWGRVGRVICRYNNWKTGNRTVNSTIVLDYTNQEAPKAMDIAGDYIFVTACKEEKMWVYRTSDGGLQGIMTPGPEVNSKSGWVDIPFGTRAFKRSNGEYLIMNEEDLFGKVILYRWMPDCNASLPSAPSNLSASAVSSTQINLTWNDNSTNEDGFTLERKIGSGSYSQVSTFGPNVTNYSNINLLASTLYTYRISATNCKGNSGTSNESSATTPTANDTQAPSVPTLLKSSNITSTSFTISWTASTDNVAVTSYEVFLGSTSVGTTATTSLNINGLVASTAYSVTVKARDAANNISAASSALNVSTSAGGSAVKLSGTTIFDVDPYGTGVAANAFDGNTGTYVDAKQTSGAYVGLDFSSAQSMGSIKFFPRSGQEARMNGGKFQGSNNGTTYTDLYTISTNPPAGWSTVTVSGSYRYVRYINNAANTYCNIAEIEFWSTGVAGDTQAPSAPTGLASSAITAKSFTLTWTASTDNIAVTSYEVFLGSTSVGTTASTSLNITGLIASTAYSVTVKARDAANNISAASSALNVSTSAGGSAVKLSGTTIFDVDPYGTGVAANAFDGNTGTYVDAKQTSGAYVGLDLASVKNLGSVKFFPRSGQEVRMNGGKFQGSNDGTTYTDLYTISTNPPAGWNTVTVSGSYRYVRYINNAANTYCNVAEIEFWSNGVAGDTQAPSAPTGLVSSAITATTFTLKWTASTDNMAVTSYEVFLGSTSVGTSASTSLNITGLIASTAYVVTVKAKDAANNVSVASSTLNVTTSALSATKLSGTTISDVDPYGTGVAANAFDGNTGTYVDAKQTSGAYVGLDLSSAQSLGNVKFFPRSGQEARMNGGKFQGSNDGTTYTDLYTISTNPPAGWNTVTVSGSYRYARYINNAANTYCNVAEIEFWSPGVMSLLKIADIEDSSIQNIISGIKVYPNTLTSGNLTISGINKFPCQISIVDITGKTIISQVVNNNFITMNNLILKPGLYFVTIMYANTKEIKKIIVK